MSVTRLADISEFQANIDARAYIGGGYSCLIVRAHNGWRKDNVWPARRDYLRQYPFTTIGYYQYLASGKDSTQQAKDFIDAVGDLKNNEFVILDHEDGSGNQVPRAEAWFGVVDKHYGFPATLYSGLSFGRTNLGGWDRWRKRPRWMAAYQTVEPKDAHELWQNTDKASFPGLVGNVDGNLFHGSERDFLRVMKPGAQPISPPGPSIADLAAKTVVQNKDGHLEEFVVSGGQIWHHWQNKPNGPWGNWASLGSP